MPASLSEACEPVPENPEQVIELPDFVFRITPDEVERYRAALGVSGARVPFGMALRALASDAAMSALRDVAAGRHPVHVAQDYRAEQPLQAGVDYACHLRLLHVATGRLRIEQRLSDASGRTCLTLASDIALVAAP